MVLYLGNQQTNNFMHGPSQVQKLYLGSSLVWENEFVAFAPLGNGENLTSNIFNNARAGVWESNVPKRLILQGGERNSLRINSQWGGKFTFEVASDGILSGGTWMEALAIDTGVTQIVPILNNGIIRGRGGNGGAGGAGGNGFANVIQREPATGEYYDANTRWEFCNAFGPGPYQFPPGCRWKWGGTTTTVAGGTTGNQNYTSHSNGGWTYYRGSQRQSTQIFNPQSGQPNGGYELFGIYRTTETTQWTTGGSGGAGGTGIGFGIARTDGQDGNWGGQNAGRGGKGGNGGNWGQPGGTGARGEDGNNGAGQNGAVGGDTWAIWGGQRCTISGSGQVLGSLRNN